MNILFMTLLYHPDTMEETAAASKDGLQNQINNYQWAFAQGLGENLAAGEALDMLNVLPVGAFPFHYRKCWLKDRSFGAHFQELGGVNFPWFKQQFRRIKAYRAIRKWVEACPDNRHILLYSLYLPYMQAIQRLKRKRPDLTATVIVTDLPNEMGISSGRRGLMQRIEYAMGRKKLRLCTAFDGFVLLTRHMAEVLPVHGKPQLVMEGLILPEANAETPAVLPEEIAQTSQPVILYTGTLNRELGIRKLLEAFAHMPEYTLWLCGKGDMEAEIRDAAKKHPNIRYFGFVSQGEALALQSKADVLINPREGAGSFTRYSFPSKTLEYMRAGKPVLCYQLEGIPEDYAPYLVYIAKSGSIAEALKSLLSLPKETREKMGEAARNYVLREKNANAQGSRLLSFLRDFSAS